jgi:hypothetical protein
MKMSIHSFVSSTSSVTKPPVFLKRDNDLAAGSREQSPETEKKIKDLIDISRPDVGEMTAGEPTSNFRILARYPVVVADIGDEERLLVDVNQNTYWDFGETSFWTPNTHKSLEPVLDVRYSELKLYAQANGHGFLTAEHFNPATVDVKRTQIYSNVTYQLTPTGETLSDLAQDLNPFKSAPNASQVQWALAPRKNSWDLYLFTPAQGPISGP